MSSSNKNSWREAKTEQCSRCHRFLCRRQGQQPQPRLLRRPLRRLLLSKLPLSKLLLLRLLLRRLLLRRLLLRRLLLRRLLLRRLLQSSQP